MASPGDPKGPVVGSSRGPAWGGEGLSAYEGALNCRVQSGSVAGHTQAVFSLTKGGRLIDQGASRQFWRVPSGINQY